MSERIVLIGAGSAVFTRGLVADLIRLNVQADLALVDIDPDALRVAESLTRKMIESKDAPTLPRFDESTQRAKGCTAMVCTIGVGGRRAGKRMSSHTQVWHLRNVGDPSDLAARLALAHDSAMIDMPAMC